MQIYLYNFLHLLSLFSVFLNVSCNRSDLNELELANLSSQTTISARSSSETHRMVVTNGNIKTLLAPVAWQINQRDGANTSRFKLALELGSSRSDVTQLRFSVFNQNFKPILAPTFIDKKTCKEFSSQYIECLSPQISAGGRYIFKLETISKEGIVLGTAEVNHIGVGEIIITAGQSNTVLSGEPITDFEPSQNNSVAAIWKNSVQWEAVREPMAFADGHYNLNPPNLSSVWPTLGKRLSQELGVPVAFVITGCGATFIDDWQQIPKYRDDHESARQCAKNSGFNSLFERLAKAATTLTSDFGGFRVILWHQGENDTIANTSSSEYFEAFKKLKLNLDQHLPLPAAWVVARASLMSNEIWQNHLDGVPWGPTKDCKSYPLDSSLFLWNSMRQIRLGQEMIWNAKLAIPGPDTDALNGPHRSGTASGVCVHYSTLGIQTVANAWYDSLSPYLQSLKKSGDPFSDEPGLSLTEIYAVTNQQQGRTATITSDFIFDYFDSELNPAHQLFTPVGLFQIAQYFEEQFKLYIVSKNNLNMQAIPWLHEVFLNKIQNQYLTSFENTNSNSISNSDDGKYLLGYAGAVNFENSANAATIKQNILKVAFRGASAVYSIKIRQCRLANGEYNDVFADADHLLNNSGKDSEYNTFCNSKDNHRLLSGGYWAILVCAQSRCKNSGIYGW